MTSTTRGQPPQAADAYTRREKHERWCATYRRLREIAERIDRMRTERAWALAATVGIPRCGCSLHNASIDVNMTGWCHGNRNRLRVARAAVRIMNSAFDGYRIVDRWCARQGRY